MTPIHGSGLHMNPIYLDYNATTPVDPAMLEAMRPFLHEQFGKPYRTREIGSTPGRIA